MLKNVLGSEVSVPFSDGGDDGDVLSPERTPDDVHAPLTPPRAAERWLVDIDTSQISASALAQQIHRTGRSGTTSVATDDFASAIADDDYFFLPNLADTPQSSPFSSDVLNHQRSYPTIDEDEDEYQESNMSNTSNPAENTMHVDAAENVYSRVKGIWSWGKGVAVFSPFLGLAEGVAGKFVSVAGSNLSDLDGAIVSNLHNIDDKLLNPAIHAVVAVILGAVAKTEEIFKPMIVAVLSPIGLIKPDGTFKKPEVVPPELTGRHKKTTVQ